MTRTLLLFLISTGAFFQAKADTHSQLCENIREQVSENCSEESDTAEPDGTGGYTLIKRSFDQCFEQDFPLKVQEVNESMEDLGVPLYNIDMDTYELSCSMTESV